MTEKELGRLDDILKDAKAHPSRLSTWENTFMASIQSGRAMFGADINFSEKQWEILTRIERKLFAT